FRGMAVTAGVVAGVSCGELPTDVPDAEASFTITVQATDLVAGVSVVVSAEDIPTPIVQNLPLVDDVASGTVHIPAGTDRLIVVHAYDDNGIETHRGQALIDVQPGANLSLSITLEPLTGDVPIEAELATYTVVIDPADATATVGETVRYMATVTDANGPVADPAIAWGSTNPVVAAVDDSGFVTASAVGTATITATYRGVVALAGLIVGAAEGPTGRIVFASNREDIWGEDIYAMNADGSGVTQLTSGPAEDRNSIVSPDGARIAFASDRSGNFELWVMDIDGANPVEVSAGLGVLERSFAWAPDGSKLAYTDCDVGTFYSCRPYEVWIVNADGTGNVNVTNDSAAIDLDPTWAPDGRTIAFTSDRSGNADIWTVNADGTGLTQLTTSTDDEYEPRWSPDGDRILYFRSVSGSGQELWVMDADGSNQTALVTPGEPLNSARWSPSGGAIAFLSGVTGATDLYVMSANGSGRINLTNTDDVYETWFWWSPDGAYLVFDREVGMNPDETWNYDIYTVAATGGTPVNITNAATRDELPTWAPLP
ncbi:MAG: Ig-like domain-containing protein, partial [Gemmatimonadota bacterium]